MEATAEIVKTGRFNRVQGCAGLEPIDSMPKIFCCKRFKDIHIPNFVLNGETLPRVNK